MRSVRRFALPALLLLALGLAGASGAAPIQSSGGGFWSMFDPDLDDDAGGVMRELTRSSSSSTTARSFWDHFATSPQPRSSGVTLRRAEPNGRTLLYDLAPVDGGTAAVPEPGAALLFASGFAAVLYSTRRRRA